MESSRYKVEIYMGQRRIRTIHGFVLASFADGWIEQFRLAMKRLDIRGLVLDRAPDYTEKPAGYPAPDKTAREVNEWMNSRDRLAPEIVDATVD